jgi:cell division protein FtsQ
MAPQANARKQRRPAARVLLRYGFLAVGVFVLLSGAIYASQRLEQFLIRDPRFFLPGPADYGLESPNVELHGLQYASRSHILRLLEPDYGQSLFLFPLEARRKALLGIRWVHEASIVRIWPNRIIVQISERTPAAFIKLPADGMARWALIDDEGVILDPPPKAPFRLPVLSGVASGESAEKRGVRVRRMRRLLRDLGPLANQVSEVDASDLDDLKVTELVNHTAVSLMLGDRNFSQRLRNFLEHYPDIHHRMPQATAFDLRLDDRITGLEGAGDAQ